MTDHSIAEARNHLSKLIDRALKGEDVVITRHGQPVVELKPVRRVPKPMTEADLAWLDAHRVPRATQGINAGEFVSKMRDEDDERLFRR